MKFVNNLAVGMFKRFCLLLYVNFLGCLL